MNIHQNSSDLQYELNKLSKNNISKDLLKIIPSNQITITSSIKNSSSNIHHTHISTFEEEEIEKDEEEEINSDEYVSSTNLDVETNTYINDEKSESQNLNINNQKGRLKPKKEEFKIKNIINNDVILKNINNNKTINTEKINQEKKRINGKNIINNNDIIERTHHHFKSEMNDINNNRQYLTNKGKRVVITSNLIEKNDVSTPSNKDKKTMKILKGIILKRMKHDHGYNNKSVSTNNYNVNKLNTINIPENNIKSINNKNRNKEIYISHVINDNKNRMANNISNKNIHIKNIQQKNIQNNNININIYNKNIIKDIGGINIDGQKYHLIPQTQTNKKTQGRVGKVVYSNQNKKNNFVYIVNTVNNNSTINSNKIPNSPIIKKNNTTINSNRLNSPNSIINNKAKIEQRGNVHNIKNLKADNLQKTIHKYLLENKYMTILPSSPNERKREGKNNEMNKINRINNQLNINNKRQLRSVNSCYSKKINKNLFNNYKVENIMNTISNNHNQRNKLNYNLSQENNTIKNALSIKKKKNNKNRFVLQSCVFSLDNPIKENNNFINNNKSSYIKRTKPLNSKIKLDLTNE